MSKHKRPKWERINGSRHLRATNPARIDTKYLEGLLAKVVQDDPGYKKRFSTEAAAHFRTWFAQLGGNTPKENRLRWEAYCLLSNWFLTECSASRSLRAGYAMELWRELFRCVPKRRLTDRKNNRKAIVEEFQKWWDGERCA